MRNQNKVEAAGQVRDAQSLSPGLVHVVAFEVLLLSFNRVLDSYIVLDVLL